MFVLHALVLAILMMIAQLMLAFPCMGYGADKHPQICNDLEIYWLPKLLPDDYVPDGRHADMKELQHSMTRFFSDAD